MFTMDLDFDLPDLTDDKIKTFLLSKLEEIKANNDKLKVTLQKRQQSLKGIIDNADVKMDDTNVKISCEVWKKIFNNKYALGVTVENNGSSAGEHSVADISKTIRFRQRTPETKKYPERCLRNIKVLLQWNSAYPLEYQVIIFEENHDLNPSAFLCSEENCNRLTDFLRKSDTVDRLAHVVIVLEQPKFIDKLSYNITGNIIFQQDDSEIVLMLPSVEISAQDALSSHLRESSLPRGGIQDILTLISCTERTELVMIFSTHWSSSVDCTFEILCSLTKVAMSSNCKKFFVAHMLSPVFDGSLLEFHTSTVRNKKVHHVTIYSRNEDSLLALLHHLHKNIAGVVIIPKMFHENYVLRKLDCTSEVEEHLEKFNECVNKEINFVNNFLDKYRSNKNADGIIKFRTDLANLERHTDVFYLRICQLNDQF